MTTSAYSAPLPAPIPSTLKKKRVLLVDTSPAKRGLRAEVMRKLGMDVDCAADIAEARSWWRADLYDLVLINAAKGPGYRDQFCDDIRGATPPQQLAFFVGEPQYLAAAPNADNESASESGNHQAIQEPEETVPSPEQEEPPQHWGILEASRRISSVRAACNARIRAKRDRPTPPRDFEGRPRRSTALTLDELLREEMR